MRTSSVALAGIFLALAYSDPQNGGFTLPGTIYPSTVAAGPAPLPTGSYLTYTSQEIASTKLPPTSSGAELNTLTASNASTTSNPLLITGPSTASTTRPAPPPSNTQACNGHSEFCSRRYMNITQVCAHNSAFVKKNNAATNQAIEITGQLNDGVRMSKSQARSVHVSDELTDPFSPGRNTFCQRYHTKLPHLL